MVKNSFDGAMSLAELQQFRRMVEAKGKAAVLKDPSVGHIFSDAEKLDVQRKGFLQALADICRMGISIGIPKNTIIECLKGAIEGLERV